MVGVISGQACLIEDNAAFVLLTGTLLQSQWKLPALIPPTNPPTLITPPALSRHLLLLQVQSTGAPPRDQVSDYISGHVVSIFSDVLSKLGRAQSPLTEGTATSPAQGRGLHSGRAAGTQTSATRNLWDPAGGPDRAAARDAQWKHLAGEHEWQRQMNTPTGCCWRFVSVCAHLRVSPSCPSSVSTVWRSSRTTTWRTNSSGCLMLDTDCSICSSCTTHSAGGHTYEHAVSLKFGHTMWI